MSEPVGITPYLVALLACERIIIEEGSRTKTLVGMFEGFRPAALPTTREMAVYAKITDAEGFYAFRLDFWHLSSGRLIDRIDAGTGQIVDRLRYTEIVARAVVLIDAEGVYEFELRANDKPVGRIRFTVS